jgi:hypothetical protein
MRSKIVYYTVLKQAQNELFNMLDKDAKFFSINM